MEVFALFYCDAWKTPGSMRLIDIYDDISILKKHIRIACNNKDMEFDISTQTIVKQQGENNEV
jgi:hypothetical protein